MNIGNFHFQIACIKSKFQLTQRFHTDKQNEVVYETSLVMLPLFKFTNALPRTINIWYNIIGGNSNGEEN